MYVWYTLLASCTYLVSEKPETEVLSTYLSLYEIREEERFEARGALRALVFGRSRPGESRNKPPKIADSDR